MPFDEFMRIWDLADICHMSCDNCLDQIDKLDDVEYLISIYFTVL
jgi:hypothetical protein